MPLDDKGMPPLPKRAIRVAALNAKRERQPMADYFTADQMRAYARQYAEQARADQRERDAQIADAATHHRRVIRSATNGAPMEPCEVAAAIRAAGATNAQG